METNAIHIHPPPRLPCSLALARSSPTRRQLTTHAVDADSAAPFTPALRWPTLRGLLRAAERLDAHRIPLSLRDYGERRGRNGITLDGSSGPDSSHSFSNSRVSSS